jgi:hypothetical protein
MKIARPAVFLVAATLFTASCSSNNASIDVPVPSQVPSQVSSTVVEDTALASTVATTSSIPELPAPDIAADLPNALSRLADNTLASADLQHVMLDPTSFEAAFLTAVGPARLVYNDEFGEGVIDISRGWRNHPIKKSWVRNWEGSSYGMQEAVLLLETADDARIMVESWTEETYSYATPDLSLSSVYQAPAYVGFFETTEPRNPLRACIGQAFVAKGRFVLIGRVELESCKVTPAPWANTIVANSVAATLALFNS